jgi:hypothetical protein
MSVHRNSGGGNPAEERDLHARFGVSYDRYISRTGAPWRLDPCGDREGSA